MTTCIRRAWLTLDTLSIPLEDPTAGYVCQSLDLGYPIVREQTNNIADRDGADDLTALMGPRAVTANLTALVGAGARIDQVAAAFGRYMTPAARPVLHYILDRDDNPERVLTLRATGYSWPIVGDNQRDIQLAWVAPDPIAYDPTLQHTIGWSGSSAPPGRSYPLAFDRIYPPGASASGYALIHSYGDVGVRPLLRIYGPVTEPLLTFEHYLAGGYQGADHFGFDDAFVIDAGRWVDIDSQARTVNRDSDPTRSCYGDVDWANSTWPYVAPDPYYTHVTLDGSTTSGITQVVAYWQDGYLS